MWPNTPHPHKMKLPSIQGLSNPADTGWVEGYTPDRSPAYHRGHHHNYSHSNSPVLSNQCLWTVRGSRSIQRKQNKPQSSIFLIQMKGIINRKLQSIYSSWSAIDTLKSWSTVVIRHPLNVIPVVWDVHDGHSRDLPDPSLQISVNSGQDVTLVLCYSLD